MKRKKKKRKHVYRSGEYTCTCGIYHFPHRMFGGRCNGSLYIEKYWSEHYGAGACNICSCFVDGVCQVLLGQEHVKYCNALQEFVEYNEIKTPLSWNKKKRILSKHI